MSRDATTIPFLDLARQAAAIRDELTEAVGRVLNRGWYVLGEEVAAFEREFAEFCGVRHAVGLNSGTDAIHLALRACGVGTGDAVATAPNVSAPTACAIEAAGARPVYVDIDPVTQNLDPDALGRVLAEGQGRIKAVVPIHLYGLAAAMDPIREVARAHDAEVVEDAAQGHGSTYRGRPVGGLSRAGCFSFYPTKNLGAAGDAGAVTTDDDDIADRMRRLRNYGEIAKYRNESLGFNSRLDELQAAILRVKLRHLDDWVEARRRIARVYDQALAETGLVLPPSPEGDRHSYHLYVVRTPDRDDFRAFLKARGVETAIHYPTPLHLQGFQAYLGHRPGDFPEAERACREVVSLPLYPELREEEVARVVAAVRGWAVQSRGGTSLGTG